MLTLPYCPTDLPYWPSQNVYVYKEVWIHPSSRWLWMMADLLGWPVPLPARSGLDVSVTSVASGEVHIRVTVTDPRIRTLTLRSDNLAVPRPIVAVRRRGGRLSIVEWTGRRTDPAQRWSAVVVPDGNVSRRREVH